MRSPLLLAGAVGLLALAALLGAALLLDRGPATDADRVASLAAELRCPDCQALSVAESRTRAAAAIRDEIAAQVAAGRNDDEVRRHFVERYGEWILLAPDDPLVWWLPVAAVLAGIGLFGVWVQRGRSRPGRSEPEAPHPGLTDADRRHLAEELEAIDG
jgi:cytochrome c-type biogenesis protein CcmH